ncbi:SNARE domain protein [Theileria parva strain Muguga]|uniref:Syntaxin 5, putative n=1 Tax=Theileria parva TaxID=5875 RepID=Q4N5G6_THEPA|nr:SNARE domain protein [Theileria parva strain Muguga]EAN32607.1 SNARE domain protein [Theileria parva strain Muguga]|eukprot:XP_764890.1 syntaxin 5 [Theileria parva strain Muguga]
MVNSVDRTKFFMTQVNQNSNLNNTQAPKTFENLEFNTDADSIYKEIEKARAKLNELSQLAKKRSLYLDNTSSIERLTSEIKSILTYTTSSIDLFENRINSFKFRNEASKKHYTSIIFQLRNDIFNVTNTFKETLHQRAQIMQEQENRRKLYAINDMDAQTSGIGRKRFMLQQDLEAEQQLDLESGITAAPSTSVISNAREEAIANVQRAIGDLSQIFQKVTAYVTQQDEMINRIDFDTEVSLSNVRSAKNELLKYYRRISSNRGLIIKILILVTVLTCLYIMFVM